VLGYAGPSHERAANDGADDVGREKTAASTTFVAADRAAVASLDSSIVTDDTPNLFQSLVMSLATE
jgi:hypothetical protein